MAASTSSPDKTIEILVIGYGALGTIYSWVLSQAKNVRVTALARSSYHVFKEHGVTIQSEKFGDIEGWQPYRLLQSVDDANDRTYDFIVVTHKCLPDLIPLATTLAPLLDGEHGPKDGQPGPAVVLIMNGVGIEHPLAIQYRTTPIISAVAWIGANMHPDGIVTHGSLEKLIIGLYQGEGGMPEGHPEALSTVEHDLADPARYFSSPDGEKRRLYGVELTKAFERLLKEGGGGVERVDDIQPHRYAKNAWNISYSAICSLSRQPVSAVVAPQVTPFTLPIIRRAMLEQLYVARAWGLSEEVLPMSTVDDTIKMTTSTYQERSGMQTPGVNGRNGAKSLIPMAARQLTSTEATSAFKPSMLLDIESGRPFELEAIVGSVLDRARMKAVETPRLDVLYAILKINQDAAVRKQADSQHDLHRAVSDWAVRKPAVSGAKAQESQDKSWDNAVRQAHLERASKVANEMTARSGKVKVTGKPVNSAQDEEE